MLHAHVHMSNLRELIDAEMRAVEAGRDYPDYRESFSDDYFKHQMRTMQDFVKVCKMRMETLHLADKAIAMGEVILLRLVLKLPIRHTFYDIDLLAICGSLVHASCSSSCPEASESQIISFKSRLYMYKATGCMQVGSPESLKTQAILPCKT